MFAQRRNMLSEGKGKTVSLFLAFPRCVIPAVRSTTMLNIHLKTGNRPLNAVYFLPPSVFLLKFMPRNLPLLADSPFFLFFFAPPSIASVTSSWPGLARLSTIGEQREGSYVITSSTTQLATVLPPSSSFLTN